MKLKYIFKSFLLITLTFVAFNIQAQFKVPGYQKFKLKNGLTVYLMEQHEVPTINVSAIFPAGSIYDQKQSGLASLTASALMHGTTKTNKQTLDETLDFHAARVGTGSSKEFASLSAEFAAKDREKILSLISEIIQSPSFDTAEFSKEKQRILIGLEQMKESPRNVIGAYYEKFLFGNHVYGNVNSGSVKTVTPITTTDLKAFYTANYFPEGSAIAVVGDFKSADMKKLITKYFSTWKKTGKNVKQTDTKFNTPNKSRVLLVNKADARETTFYIGGFGVSRNNPDMVAIDVVNTYFGGRFTSLLNDELRVNSGLTYGASSRFNSYKHNGTFYITTFTANKTTEAAINKTLEIINRLHDKGLDEASLTSAKNYIKGQFPPRYETNGQLAGLLTSMFWYNYDESYINNFEKNVDGLTVAKAKEIIAKYFPKDKLQFVLIGKAEEISDYAKTLGEVTQVEIKSDIE